MSARLAAAALALRTAFAGASTRASAVAEPSGTLAPPTIAENPECPPAPVVPDRKSVV